MTDAELYACVRGCLLEEIRLFGVGSGAHVRTWPGVVASVSPRVPDRSLFNSIAHESVDALVAVYDEARDGYADAGVRAFTDWVAPGDDASARELAARGHVLDASPRAMAAPLADVTLPAPGDLDWRATDDLALIGRINDAAYGLPPSFERGLATPPPRWYAYVARVASADAACLMVYESAAGDAGLCAVATLPAAQGRGLASRLFAVALDAARSRGAVTTSLQASKAGAPVYARLGYRDLGAMQMWERRETP
jgi:GNAT superfamily N-acetyltransferase